MEQFIPPELRQHAKAITNGVRFIADALKITDTKQVNDLGKEVIKNIKAGAIKPTISSIGRWGTQMMTLGMDALPGAKFAKIPIKGAMDLGTMIEKGVVKKGTTVPTTTDEVLVALDKKKAKQDQIREVKKKRIPPSPFESQIGTAIEALGEDVLLNPKRDEIILKYIQENLPPVMSRKRTLLNKRTVNKILAKNYGKRTTRLPGITHTPGAAELVAKLIRENPNIKSKAIREELTTINPKFSQVTDETITAYLKRNHAGQRRWKTTEEKRLSEKARHDKAKEWDDPEASKTVESLQETVSPFFKTKILQSGETLSGAHPTLIKHRTKPEGKTFVTTKTRNTKHIRLENQAKDLMEQKNNIVSQMNPNNREIMMDQLDAVNLQIRDLNASMKDLGLESKLWNERTKKFEYFGELFGTQKSPILELRESIIKKGGWAAGGPVPKEPEAVPPTQEENIITSIKEQFFKGQDYPYKISDKPIYRGFIEDIEQSTPEQRIDIYKKIRLQPLEDAIKEYKEKNRTSAQNENLSEEAKQYLLSKNTVDNQEVLFRARVETASLCQPTPDDPYCKAMFPNGVPDILDLAEEFENFKNTDHRYLDMTERARGVGPYKETTKKAKREILANQIKNVPAHVADVLIDVYQILSPPALVSGEMMYLDEIKKGQYIEKEDIGEYVQAVNPTLSDEYKDELVETYTMLYDTKDLRIVPPGAAKPQDPSGWQRAKAYGLSAASIATLFTNPNYVSRIAQVLSRKDIGPWGKTLRVAPKALGIPSKKEVIGVLKLLKDGALGTLKAPVKIPYKAGQYVTATVKPGTEGTFYVGSKTLPELGLSLPASEISKRSNIAQMIKNINMIIGDIESQEVGEQIKLDEKEYQANIQAELRNPQYTNEIKILYEDALRTKLANPNEILGEAEDVEIFDMLSKASDFENLPKWVRRYAKEMADQYIDINNLKTSTIGDTLFYDMFNKNKMALGGDPGPFSPAVGETDDETINIDEFIQSPAYLGLDELDIFEESKREVPQLNLEKDSIFDDEASFEVANVVFGKAPGWAIAGANKVDELIGAGKVAGRIAQSNKLADDAVSQGEKINRFYSGIEARLLDPNSPEVFETPADLYSFLNSKGISKLEVEDYQIPQLLETMVKTGQPINKSDLLNRIKLAPIRQLKSTVRGFRSEMDDIDGEFIPGKFADQYIEKGYVPNTYRENILYIDPKNLPHDIKAYKHSTHGFFPDDEVQYVIGWSRLTDRPGILPGTGKQLSADTTTKLFELEKKRDRLQTIVNKSPEDLVSQSQGRISIEQAQKNIDNASKQLTKIQDNIDNFGVGTKEGVIPDQQIKVTFADEIQSDIFQTYRKHLEQVKKDYQKLIEKGVNPKDLKRVKSESYRLETKTDPAVMAFYSQYKDIMRPLFKTEEDFAAYINDLQKTQAVFKDFAKIKPGNLSPQDLKLVQEAGKKRDTVLEVFEKAFTDPKVLKQLFPNIPFKDRKAWGDAIIKNDLHQAAKRLFIDKDPNASSWYAISPADLITKRYSQAGTTATPYATRTKDMKGIGQYEFYGGPNATDPLGKHYTSVLEAALKRAASVNNSEVKIIKVAVGEPKKIKKVVQVWDKDGKVIKEFKVTDNLGDTLNKAEEYVSGAGLDDLSVVPREIPSGFKTVDAYAIKLTPEMVLPTKTHFASGGYAVYNPLVSMDEVIGAY